MKRLVGKVRLTERMLVGVFLVFLINPIHSAPLDRPVLTLTERNSGSVVSLRPSQILEVVLPANPTTGYRWETLNKDEPDEGQRSNVVMFAQALKDATNYHEGVGIRLRFIGKVLGGVMGASGRTHIREMTTAR